MRRTDSFVTRIMKKTSLFALISSLRRDYNLSRKEAELLSNDFIYAYTQDNPANLLDGQIFYTAIHKDEPHGKPLSECRKVRIKLTLLSHDFINISSDERNRLLVYSLPYQALSQDALLTDEDLAFILNLSLRTVARIHKEFKASNLYIPTRGNFHLFGAGQTHKGEALKLFFSGKQISEIAFLLNHSAKSIERYIDDFAKVSEAYKKNFSTTKISKLTNISAKVVREYIEIYKKIDKQENQERLEFLKHRVELLEKKSEYRSNFYGKIKRKSETN